MKKYSLLFLFIIFSFLGNSQSNLFPHQNKKWVDSVFNSLSLEEKIGQLLMPRGNVSREYDLDRLKDIVEKYHVGGFVFFAGSPEEQAKTVNLLQSLSKTPLFIGMDLEWGLDMRLKNTVKYPFEISLGGMEGNNDLIEEMGFQIAEQCKRLGIHISYGPVVDINNNPNNPVINFRSFGEDKEMVTAKSLAMMKGIQKGHIITSAKHFPGHGDTDVDSHKDIPVLSHTYERLDSLELYPYKKLIKNGLTGVMVGHLGIPEIDSTPNLASTLSKPIISGILREDLGFEGLVFTDAMDMQGVTKYFPDGEANVRAILAGNDILETFWDVPTVFNAIKTAVDSGRISIDIINEKVRKILNAKAWVGLDVYQPIDLTNLNQELNPYKADILKQELAEKSVVVLKNEGNILPLKDLSKFTIASLAIGDSNYGKDFPNNFQSNLEKYEEMDHYYLDYNSSNEDIISVKEKLKNYDKLIISISGNSIRPSNNYGIKHREVEIFNEIVDENSIVAFFNSPFTLNKYSNILKAAAIVTPLQSSREHMKATAEVIFGSISTSAKFPITLDENFKVGDGEKISAIGRLQYDVFPERVGIDHKNLEPIVDSLIQNAIEKKAMPGAVVLIAKEGKVIYHKAFGKPTYESEIPVNLNDLYDLASITKISTSVPALMYWEDQKKFNTKLELGNFYPEFQNSNKNKLQYIDILTHQSRLKSWIPFWKDYIDSVEMVSYSPKFQDEIENGKLSGSILGKYIKEDQVKKGISAAIKKDNKFFNEYVDLKTSLIIWKPNTLAYKKSEDFPVEIAPDLFVYKNIKSRILDSIEVSPLYNTKSYVYSDLSYYLLPEVSKRYSGKDWRSFLSDTFYKPIGASTLTYNPLEKFPLSRIIPTERDSLFRKTLIHGKVHDEGAALLNGISGHAGLFGNANDLAKLMQMYLQGGYYGGIRFIAQPTIKKWTSYPFSINENPRRGIGFDKPNRKVKGQSASDSASPESFGHSGFTGTYTWIDPKYKTVYVFLANRVYPTRENSKIYQLDLRTNINEAIIESIKLGIE